MNSACMLQKWHSLNYMVEAYLTAKTLAEQWLVIVIQMIQWFIYYFICNTLVHPKYTCDHYAALITKYINKYKKDKAGKENTTTQQQKK